MGPAIHHKRSSICLPLYGPPPATTTEWAYLQQLGNRTSCYNYLHQRSLLTLKCPASIWSLNLWKTPIQFLPTCHVNTKHPPHSQTTVHWLNIIIIIDHLSWGSWIIMNFATPSASSKFSKRDGHFPISMPLKVYFKPFSYVIGVRTCPSAIVHHSYSCAGPNYRCRSD